MGAGGRVIFHALFISLLNTKFVYYINWCDSITIGETFHTSMLF